MMLAKSYDEWYRMPITQKPSNEPLVVKIVKTIGAVFVALGIAGVIVLVVVSFMLALIERWG